MSLWRLDHRAVDGECDGYPLQSRAAWDGGEYRPEDIGNGVAANDEDEVAEVTGSCERSDAESQSDLTDQVVPLDCVVKTYTNHEEGICGASWSRTDAWCFASLSADGVVSVTPIPFEEKYRILL